MNQRLIISSALASVLALGLVGQASAQAGKDKEKCFGIVKAGANDCANLSGSHSCAGQSKVSFSPEEWKYVPTGSCKNMMGMTEEVAKKMAAKK